MKGFIEVTESKNNTVLAIAIRTIDVIQDKKLILYENSLLRVKETYAEIKALIEEATKPTICNECPYSYDKTLDDALATIGFEGTMDALNRLKIRKEDSPCTSEAETT